MERGSRVHDLDTSWFSAVASIAGHCAPIAQLGEAVCSAVRPWARRRQRIAAAPDMAWSVQLTPRTWRVRPDHPNGGTGESPIRDPARADQVRIGSADRGMRPLGLRLRQARVRTRTSKRVDRGRTSYGDGEDRGGDPVGRGPSSGCGRLATDQCNPQLTDRTSWSRSTTLRRRRPCCGSGRSCRGSWCSAYPSRPDRDT